MSWHDDPDAAVRRSGCRDAREGKDASAVPQLAALLADPDRGVQDAAFEALRTLGGAGVAEAILPCLGSSDERVRNLSREILAPLAGLHPEVFLPYLRHADLNVRIFAVELLGAWRDARFLEELSGLAEDPHPNLKCQVAVTLGEMGLAGGIPILARLAEDPEEWVRFSAVEALGKVSQPASREVLTRLAAEGDGILASAAVEALLAGGEPAGAVAVLRVLGRFASDAGACARDVIGVLKILEAAPTEKVPQETVAAARTAILGVLEKGGLWDRSRAIQLLGRLRDVAAVPQLLQAAETLAGPPQLSAVEALGAIAPAEARPLLERLLRHPDVEVVERARDALNRPKRAGAGR